MKCVLAQMLNGTCLIDRLDNPNNPTHLNNPTHTLLIKNRRVFKWNPDACYSIRHAFQKQTVEKIVCFVLVKQFQ